MLKALYGYNLPQFMIYSDNSISLKLPYINSTNTFKHLINARF